MSSGLSAGSPPLLRSALRTLSFFRDYKSGLPSVLPHLARSETAHTPGSSHRQYRRSLCKPPRTEYASLSLSHIFRIHLRTAWLSFSLGKGSAREIPFFSLKNNKEEQAGVSVFAILSCRPFFILISLPGIKMNHYGFSRKSIWKNLETFP